MSTTTRLTIEQFEQMIVDGVFENELKRERIELIEGELRELSPIGPRHVRIVDILTRWSCKSLPEDQGWVRIQGDISLARLLSVPEPDVAWLRDKDYSRKRPELDDVLLLIEVADSSCVMIVEKRRPFTLQLGLPTTGSSTFRIRPSTSIDRPRGGSSAPARLFAARIAFRR